MFSLVAVTFNTPISSTQGLQFLHVFANLLFSNLFG